MATGIAVAGTIGQISFLEFDTKLFVLIVGSPHKVTGLVRRLRERVDAGYEVVGVVLSPEVEALADTLLFQFTNLSRT